MIGTDLLNDLFTNNIDFVAKQIQTIVDALFPNNENNSDTQLLYNPCIVTGQTKCLIQSVRYGTWIDVAGYYNVNYSSDSQNNAFQFIGYVSEYSNDVLSLVTRSNEYFFNDDVQNIGLPHTLKHISGNVFRIVDNNNVPYSMNWGQTDYYSRSTSGQIMYNADGYSLNDYDVSSYNINFLPDTNSFIITDKDTAQYIYNNNYLNQNDYHNDMTVNNIYVGGGAGGIAVGLPVGGLFNYNDLELAIDSLIRDLNLNFQNTQLPVTDFPSYDEIKYEDMGSFYITPVKQIPALPEAPDVADTFVDVSDYVALLGGSVTKLTSIFGSIGLDMMLVLTFLSCLVIRHLRR